jgi:hypothetical protein
VIAGIHRIHRVHRIHRIHRFEEIAYARVYGEFVQIGVFAVSGVTLNPPSPVVALTCATKEDKFRALRASTPSRLLQPEQGTERVPCRVDRDAGSGPRGTRVYVGGSPTVTIPVTMRATAGAARG